MGRPCWKIYVGIGTDNICYHGYSKKINSLSNSTVDGRNPAPPGMYKSL